MNITHLEEIEREQLVAPTSYTRRSPPGVGGQGGECNYWVPIYANAQGASVLSKSSPETDTSLFELAKTPSLIVWFFDSRSGFTPGANSVAIPDWVDDSVATWLASEIALMNAAWGPSESRAALAFVHVPL